MNTQTPRPKDWIAWHADYDRESELSRRLAIVQRHVGDALRDSAASPLRVISMCAGEGRDILGAIETQPRRDIVGRLVEINPELANIAAARAKKLGLDGLEVAVGDAGDGTAYAGVAPADLVLVCGVFGNISDSDVERTVRFLPALCVTGSTAIWTRHRRPPDLAPAIRGWFGEAGFAEVTFDEVPDSPGSVGVARYEGAPQPFESGRLFTFIRTQP